MKCSLNSSHLSLVQRCVCSVGSGRRNPAWAVPWGSGSENPLPCFCSELILWSLTGEQWVRDVNLLVWTKLGLCQILLLRRAGALDIPVHRVWMIAGGMSDAAVFWSFLSQCTHRACYKICPPTFLSARKCTLFSRHNPMAFPGLPWRAMKTSLVSPKCFYHMQQGSEPETQWWSLEVRQSH